jgi:hypothetical protein
MSKIKIALATLLLSTTTVFAAQDPGIRNDGDPGAGNPLPDLPTPLAKLFDNSKDEFTQVEGLADGLGPTMNLNSCGGCHINPAVGGTSPATNNPQVAFFNKQLNHDTNGLPFFIKPSGPIREARFPSDGGVHDLFTVAGITGAENCRITQPDFVAAQARNDLIFRVGR